MQHVQTIQEEMGFPVLQKIDPNTGEVKDPAQDTRQRLGQAAIPAALTLVSKFAATEKGLNKLAEGPWGTNWLSEILGAKQDELVSEVAKYANTDPASARQTMEDAMQLAIHHGVHLNTTNQPTPVQQTYYAGLLVDALTYLPSGVPVGKVMDDHTLDDQTHKMEGPLSSLAHSIEQVFSDIRAEDPRPIEDDPSHRK